MGTAKIFPMAAVTVSMTETHEGEYEKNNEGEKRRIRKIMKNKLLFFAFSLIQGLSKGLPKSHEMACPAI